MKKNSPFFIFFTIFLCFSSVPLHCTEPKSGYEECRLLSDFLTGLGITVKESPVLTADSNNFPFNLSADFKADEDSGNMSFRSKKAEELTDFIIMFTVEDSLNQKEFISLLVKKISEIRRKCNVSLVFTYGDYSVLNIPYKITGTEAFLEALQNKDSTSAVCVKYTDGKNAIIPGGANDTAPSWLTEIIADSFYENGISYNLKGGFISSLYSLNLMQNEVRTSMLLEAEIPAAGIELNCQKVDAEKQSDFFAKIVELYNPAETTEWDRHTNQFVIGKKILWTSEKITTVLFLAVTFFSLFALFGISFFVKISKNDIQHEILRLWYLIPLTVLATTSAFMAGQFFSSVLHKFFPIDNFTNLAVKLFTGFLFTSLYFLLIIKLQGSAVSNAYSYFVTITGIINIFLFSSIDISLFYLFAAEYIIIYFSRPVKNFFTLIIFFILLLIPLIPYSVQIIKYVSPAALPKIINGSFLMNLIIAFGFLPFEFIWLRILARLNKKWKESDTNTKRFLKQNIIAISSAVGIFAIILVTVTFLIPEKYKTVPKKNSGPYLYNGTDDILDVHYSDYNFFGETARIIFINMSEQGEACSLSVTGTSTNPVLYSNSSFYFDNINNKASFRLTAFPPKQMAFSFIANTGTDSTITVSAMIPDAENSEKNGRAEYRLYKKDIYVPKKSGGYENGK